MIKKKKLIFHNDITSIEKKIDSIEKQQTQNTILKSFQCPGCNHIIRLDENQIKNKVLQCPCCGQQNSLILPLEPLAKKQSKSNFNHLFSMIDKNAVILGLILIFFSIISLLLSSSFIFKINLTLIILGVVILLFVLEKQQNISLKVAVCIMIYIILLFFITGTDVEMFLILLFPGLSIMKIILDEYLPATLKLRMNIILLAFFIIFMIVVIKRIINVVFI